MSRIRPRAFASMMALMLIFLLGGLIATATLMQRPAVQSVNLHSAFDRAQCAADAAIQQALANLDRGLDPRCTVNISNDCRGTAEVHERTPARESVILSVRGRAPAPHLDAQTAATCACVELNVAAVRPASGAWQIRSYVVVCSRFEPE